jgi:DNA/RNA non-specific endonuclease
MTVADLGKVASLDQMSELVLPERRFVQPESELERPGREPTTDPDFFEGRQGYDPEFSEKDLPYRGALVPLAFWKVVAIVTEDGRPSATAYKIGQKKELSELEYVFGKYKTFQISIQQVIDETGLGFEPLLKYDGFSEHERVSGSRTEAPIDALERVRV